jgi:hypothetical protein
MEKKKPRTDAVRILCEPAVREVLLRQPLSQELAPERLLPFLPRIAEDIRPEVSEALRVIGVEGDVAEL